MSQEQQITPIPGSTMYEHEQEMLNGNGGLAIVPHPQPGVPDIQGVQSEGQVEGVVEELAEVGAPGVAEFQGPRIFVHAPGMSGIWRCMSKAWMKRHTSGSWQWSDFSPNSVLGPKLKSRNYTNGW